MDYKKLTQEFIEYLIDLDKYFEEEGIQPVASGRREGFSLYSSDGRCYFSLDMNRMSSLEADKMTIQTRYLTTNDWIVRLDLNSPPHTNPDGTVTKRDHIHILREVDGNLLNYAYNLDTFHELLIENTRNITKVFEEFCKYCNITINTDLQYVL